MFSISVDPEQVVLPSTFAHELVLHKIKYSFERKVMAELVSLLITAKQAPSARAVVLEVGACGEFAINVTLPVVSSKLC